MISAVQSTDQNEHTVFGNVECKLTFLCNKFTFLHLRMLHKIWPYLTLNWQQWSTKYFAVSPVW